MFLDNMLGFLRDHDLSNSWRPSTAASQLMFFNISLYFSVSTTRRCDGLTYHFRACHAFAVFALKSKGGTQLVRGVLQLLEEWEYHFALAGVAHHSVKAMLAKNIDGPSTDRDMGEEGGKQQEQVNGRKQEGKIAVAHNVYCMEQHGALLLSFVVAYDHAIM